MISCSLTNCTKSVSSESNPQQEITQSEIQPYKLYATNNMWTFIKLDTRNGKMWQVQYSVKGEEYRFETPLNLTPLASEDNASGRFELYQTQNMYNFILLDGKDGRTWQVQWSTESENQAIIPIQSV